MKDVKESVYGFGAFRELLPRVRPVHFFFAALLLSSLGALLNVLPTDDVFFRYAPAAESFARGDWFYAFHPRFGVFFTGLAGCFAFVFGGSGVAGCKAASILLFSLSVFPLHLLFERVWDRRIAFWGTLLYVFCSHLLRYAGDGVRENGKTLALAMMAAALAGMLKKRSPGDVILLSAGAALLTVIRGEGALIALFCGTAAVFLLKDFRMILSGCLLYLILILPQAAYMYRAVGYPVPELRHALILRSMGIPPAPGAQMKLPGDGP